jgi:hypothetical protein
MKKIDDYQPTYGYENGPLRVYYARVWHLNSPHGFSSLVYTGKTKYRSVKEAVAEATQWTEKLIEGLIQ